MNPFKKAIRIFASLKLAVFIILVLGILSAIGTIVEARYGDAQVAQKMIYHSVYMYTTMIALCLTLISVMIDRWPWRRHHTGFILAHVGIILTIVGAWVTQHYGIDGSMSIEIGKKSKFVTLPEHELVVFSYFQDTNPERVFFRQVDFFSNPLSKEKPLVIPLADKNLQVVRYVPYAVRTEKIVVSEKESDPPALRFQLQNDNVSFSNWLMLKGRAGTDRIDLGPAQVIFSREPYKYTGGNVIALSPSKKEKGLNYQIYAKSQKGLVKKGFARAGDVVQTDWRMQLNLRFLNYFPNAKKQVDYLAREKRVDGVTSPAILLEYDGEENWVGLNSMYRFYNEKQGYIVTYGNRRMPLDFHIKLNKFKVGRFPGSRRAASYESDVYVPELGEVNISMNEPMKYRGFTFYQASFQEDDQGRAQMSVLSVNRDPGRFLKYLGCLMIVFGSIVLFYFRRLRLKKKGN